MTTTELGPLPERAAFEAWLQEPVAAGEDPAPWLDGLAPEAAWQAWKHRGAEIARLRAELAAERERHADALRCALDALDHCCDDTGGRHRAVAKRLREMLNG